MKWNRVQFSFLLWLGFTPSAFSEVCDKERPNWLPTHGPVGPWGELFNALLSFPILAALSIFLAACWVRKTWFWILVSFSTLLVYLFFFMDENGIKAAAIREGCIGPNWPIYLLLHFLFWFSCLMAFTRWQAERRVRGH